MAKFSLKPGYAYRRRKGYAWEIVALPKEEEGNASAAVVPYTIDGAPCVVFDAREAGVEYAQTIVACVDPATVSVGTEPTPEPEKE